MCPPWISRNPIPRRRAGNIVRPCPGNGTGRADHEADRDQAEGSPHDRWRPSVAAGCHVQNLQYRPRARRIGQRPLHQLALLQARRAFSHGNLVQIPYETARPNSQRRHAQNVAAPCPRRLPAGRTTSGEFPPAQAGLRRNESTPAADVAYRPAAPEKGRKASLDGTPLAARFTSLVRCSQPSPKLTVATDRNGSQGASCDPNPAGLSRHGRSPATTGQSRAGLSSPDSRHSHGRIATPHPMLCAWRVAVDGGMGKASGRGW